MAAKYRILVHFKRSKPALVGLSLIVFMAILALLAPYIATHDPYKQDLTKRLRPPNEEFYFGTDSLGRDIFSRLLFGARLSLIAGVLSVSIGAAIGTAIGLVSGYFKGNFDKIVTRLMDLMFAFPPFLLAILIAAFLGSSFSTAIIAVGIPLVPSFARIIRSVTLSEAEESYVLAAKSLGAGRIRVIVGHIFPNTATPLIVYATLRMPLAIISVASLSFLGLGTQPPTPEWGLMISEFSQWILVAPTAILFPGIFLTVTALGFNFLGDAFRDILDPKTIHT